MSSLDEVVLTFDDPEECGLGQGEGCCAFLMIGDRWTCGRTVGGVREQVRARLEAGTMNATHDPGDRPFPDCRPGAKS